MEIQQQGIDADDVAFLKNNAVHGMFHLKEGTSCDLRENEITFYLGEYESGGNEKSKMKITVGTKEPFSITAYMRQDERWKIATVEKAKLAEKTAVLVSAATERMRAIRQEVTDEVDKRVGAASAAANALLDELI